MKINITPIIIFYLLIYLFFLLFCLFAVSIVYSNDDDGNINTTNPLKTDSIEKVRSAYKAAIHIITVKQKRIVELDKEIIRLNKELLAKTERIEALEKELAEIGAEADNWYNIFNSTIGFGYSYNQTFSVFAQERITVYKPFWFGMDARYTYPKILMAGIEIGVTF
jgi:FtsZ-binding cell division protein ZapB